MAGMGKQQAGRVTPRYQEVADAIIADIAEGQFKIGDMLPTELVLCERFGVSRFTVREALRRLEEAGLVSRRQGSGTIVRATEAYGGFVQSVHSVSELLQYPPETRLHVARSGIVKLDRRTARQLGWRAGEQRVRISGVRRVSASGAPICWSDIYLLPDFAGVVELLSKQSLPVSALVERRFGVHARRVAVELFASGTSEELAEPLGVAPGTPALTIIRRYADANDRLFEASISIHPENRFTYYIDLQREWTIPAD